MTSAYPKREPFFASRFIRLTIKCHLAKQVGADAVLILHAVAAIEDDLRYSGPAFLAEDTLRGFAGIKSKKTFLAARKRLVDAGWLAWTPGTKLRSPSYHVTVPATHRALVGVPIEASDEGIPDPEAGSNGGEILHLEEVPEPVAEAASRPDEVSKLHLEPTPPADEVPLKVPFKGEKLHPEGVLYSPNPIPTPEELIPPAAEPPPVRGDAPGLPSTIPVPPADVAPARPAAKPKRELKFTEWDRAFAGRMAGHLVVACQIPKPNIDRWADEIRLLRERDGRSEAEIEAMWEWVSRPGEWWRRVIQSPEKLRKHWGKLFTVRAEQQAARGSNGPASGPRLSKAMKDHLDTQALLEALDEKHGAEQPDHAIGRRDRIRLPA